MGLVGFKTPKVHDGSNDMVSKMNEMLIEHNVDLLRCFITSLRKQRSSSYYPIINAKQVLRRNYRHLIRKTIKHHGPTPSHCIPLSVKGFRSSNPFANSKFPNARVIPSIESNPTGSDRWRYDHTGHSLHNLPHRLIFPDTSSQSRLLWEVVEISITRCIAPCCSSSHRCCSADSARP